MFQPRDKFYNNIQLNSVIYESKGIVVNEAVDMEKRKKYVLIERSTSDENEYAELQKDICAFDKCDSPYVLKIHKYTYDLIIPDQSNKLYNNNSIQDMSSPTKSNNLFSKNAQSIINSSYYSNTNSYNNYNSNGLNNNQKNREKSNNKKIYKLSFLTDFFTTNLRVWIDKKREEIDKHNSQFKSTSLYQKGNIRKGLPQYEFCSLLHQMAEGIHYRENKKNNQSLKDYVCNVQISAENFVVNENVDLESKIKFIPMLFLSVYNPNQKKRFTSLLEHQEKYTLKRRQTLELQNELLFSCTSPSSTNIKNNSGKKSSTFNNISESDCPTTPTSSTKILSNMNKSLTEETEIKYMRQLFDLGLKLGALYIGTDNFTEPCQPLTQFSRQVFQDVSKNYRNVSFILAQMIDPTYYIIQNNQQQLVNYKKGTLSSVCFDLKKINDQEYQSDNYDLTYSLNNDNNNNNIFGVNTKTNNNNDWGDTSISKQGISKQLNSSQMVLKKQSSILSSTSTTSFNSISNDYNTFAAINEYPPNNNNNQQSRTSLKLIQRQNSLRKSSKLLNNLNSNKNSNNHDQIKYLDTSPSPSCPQIEIYDIEYAYEKKPKKYKGIAFIAPYTNLLNIIHINEKKNAYIEKIEIKQPEKVIIAHQHSCIVIPGVGEFKVYILGGQDTINTFEFDSNYDGKLNIKSNMLAVKERRNFGVCVFDRDTKIMVATGVRDDCLTSQSEIYDIQKNQWSKVSNVNVPVLNSSLCLFNKSNIYKFGGVDANNKITKVIEKYDIYQDIWRCIQYDIDPYLNQGISFAQNMLSIQINHDQIIIFGGEQNVSNQNISYQRSHPFYQMQQPHSPASSDIHKKIFFCHIDKLGHHELFGIDQYGFIPDNAGYILPGQISLSEGEVIFFQKQLYRSDTGKLMGFSVDNQVRNIRETDIRF